VSDAPSRTSFQFSLAGLLVFITCFCICCGLYQAITRRVEVKNATAKEANDARRWVAGPTLHLPETASRIDAEISFSSFSVSYDIPESDFLKWCENRTFELESVTSSGTSDTFFEVDGYAHFWPDDVKRMWMSRRGAWSVMYDLDRGRAYVYYAPN
jgi:hypothetical protein